MTDPQTYQDLITKMQGILDKLDGDLLDKLKHMADILNDAADSFDWSLLGGPIVWIYKGLTKDDVEKAIDKFNDEIVPTVWNEFERLVQEMQKVIDSLFGDPKGLKELSWNYADVRQKLKPGDTPKIADEIAALGMYWQGKGFDSYKQFATTESTAIDQICDGMDAAADHTNLAGQQLLELWAKLGNDVVNFLSDLVELLGNAATVNEILSFEIPAVTKLVSKVLKFAGQVALDWENYVIKQGFDNNLNWQQLQNGKGGLDGAKWPVSHQTLVHLIDDPHTWGVKP